MNNLSDKAILNSWNKNAKPWVSAIKNGEIKSRIAITNKAILDTVLQVNPESVLDIGCGEGWLVRELTKRNIDTLGIDAITELVDAAIIEGGGKYKVLPYEELSYSALKKRYDVVVSNFSLLGNESVTSIFCNVGQVLNKNGYLIVQTIHPLAGAGNEGYKEGWRQGTWSGFNKDFTDPAPWYFRTIESWKSLYLNNNIIIENTLEPRIADAENPASIIFIGKLKSKV